MFSDFPGARLVRNELLWMSVRPAPWFALTFFWALGRKHERRELILSLFECAHADIKLPSVICSGFSQTVQEENKRIPAVVSDVLRDEQAVRERFTPSGFEYACGKPFG